MPGAPLDGAGDADQARIGRTLAAVHRATAGHVVPGALPWHWVDPTSVAADPSLHATVLDAVTAIESLDALVTGVGHGDPTPEAFLADGSTTGLIDWGSPVNGPLLYDVASAAMYLGGVSSAATMVASYAAAGGPATPDLAHLDAMLRFRWAVQADYFAHRIAADDRTGLADEHGNRADLDDARAALLGCEDR